MQLQNQSQVEAIIFSNPGTDGINRVVFLFLQTNEGKINTNHVSYFENKMAWQNPKPMAHLLSLSQLDFLVKPTSIPCLFLVGITNHFVETMKKPRKTKTNCVTTFDNHLKTTLTRLQ